MEWTLRKENMKEVASAFWKKYKERRIFALHGEMGSGKTTFVHALCDAMQVSSTVGSPSFAIINEYLYPAGKIFHIDLYRLKDEDEAIRAGVEDCFYSGGICLVEWPEKAAGIFPPDTVHISIEIIDPDTRRIRGESPS